VGRHWGQDLGPPPALPRVVGTSEQLGYLYKRLFPDILLVCKSHPDRPKSGTGLPKGSASAVFEYSMTKCLRLRPLLVCRSLCTGSTPSTARITIDLAIPQLPYQAAPPSAASSSEIPTPRCAQAAIDSVRWLPSRD
jgi:hypothetical protein